MLCLFDLSCISYLTVFGVIIASIYYYSTRKYNYWSSRGVNGPKPLPFVGNLWEANTNVLPELEDYRFKKYGRIYGIYEGSKPVLRVGDPELIKNITIKDFNVFVNRRDNHFGQPIIDRNVSAVGGEDWKQLRSVISPTFSSGKMRKMHPLIEECVKSLENALTKTANNANNEIELKKLMGNYTMDVIGLCAFATKIDSHNDPNNHFIKNARRSFSARPWRFILYLIFPSFLKFFNISIVDPTMIEFFSSVIKTIISKRGSNKKQSNDFLQLLIDARKKTSTEEPEDKGNDTESHHGNEYNVKLTNKKIQITDDDIIANSFIFFVAGYETTASMLSFLFYSLALDTECQQKLYEEVIEFDGKIDYDTIARMPYLDACISETLRLYTIALFIERTAGEDYPLGETGIIIEKGTLVEIPAHAIHHDEEFYPNPYRFDPQRFMPENRQNLTPYTYLPFGSGPRNCVGMRFALMEAKTAIVSIITKFKFVRTVNTKVPLEFLKGSRLLKAKDITVGIELRN